MHINILLQAELVSEANGGIDCDDIRNLIEVQSLKFAEIRLDSSALLNKVAELVGDFVFSTGSVHAFYLGEIFLDHFLPVLHHLKGTLHLLQNALLNILQSVNLVVDDLL